MKTFNALIQSPCKYIVFDYEHDIYIFKKTRTHTPSKLFRIKRTPITSYRQNQSVYRCLFSPSFTESSGTMSRVHTVSANVYIYISLFASINKPQFSVRLRVLKLHYRYAILSPARLIISLIPPELADFFVARNLSFSSTQVDRYLRARKQLARNQRRARPTRLITK